MHPSLPPSFHCSAANRQDSAADAAWTPATLSLPSPVPSSTPHLHSHTTPFMQPPRLTWRMKMPLVSLAMGAGTSIRGLTDSRCSTTQPPPTGPRSRVAGSTRHCPWKSLCRAAGNAKGAAPWWVRMLSWNVCTILTRCLHGCCCPARKCALCLNPKPRALRLRSCNACTAQMTL